MKVSACVSVVRNAEVRERVCQEVIDWIDSLPKQHGAKWKSVGLTESPVTGRNGNVEFIVYAQLSAEAAPA